MSRRDDSLVNGGLIAVGALGIVDNVVFHWLLDLHRIIDGGPPDLVLALEVGAVVLGVALVVIGLTRERRARRPGSGAASS